MQRTESVSPFKCSVIDNFAIQIIKNFFMDPFKGLSVELNRKTQAFFLYLNPYAFLTEFGLRIFQGILLHLPQKKPLGI